MGQVVPNPPVSQPLLGKWILVTRASNQAGDLSRLLTLAGATAVELPAIRIEPPANWAPLDRAIAMLADYAWVVFTSANGVRGFFDRLAALGQVFPAGRPTKVAAIGPGTAAALAQYDVRPDLVPDKQIAETMALALAEQCTAGARVLLARAAEGREALVTELSRQGIVVEDVPTYRTVAADDSGPRLRDLLRTLDLDAITFASSSSVRSVVAMLGPEAADRLRSVTVACIGPVAAHTARELGLRVDVVPNEYTVSALVRALGDHFRDGKGRKQHA